MLNSRTLNLRFSHILTFTLSICAFLNSASASEFQQSLTTLQHQWAETNYDLSGDAQFNAFEGLIKDANQAVATHPDRAELLIWRGIIYSTYAGAKGGLGALKYAKASKADLEQALAMEASALQGSAYTSLGTLYFKVPGWPISFGDDDKAAELLQKALLINPDGIDPNYFFADYLMEEGDYEKAEHYLLRAQQATSRPGRERADQGRHDEIIAALKVVRHHLQ